MSNTDVVHRLSGLMQFLYDIRQKKTVLEKLEKSILADLKPLADPEFAKTPGVPIIQNNLILTCMPGTSRSISMERLLERGVSPDIVAYATKVTTYTQYRISMVKEGGE